MAHPPSPTSLLEPLSNADLRDPNCGLTRTERSKQTAQLLQAAAATDDEDAATELRARVVLMNRGVAEAVARRYQGRGIPVEDLVQVAQEGLVKSVSRFDPVLRNDLLTFAVPTIRGEVQRYFRDHGWMVRPTRRVQELQGLIRDACRELEQRVGGEPSEQQVADHVGVPVEEYRTAVAAHGCFQPVSLDLPVGSDRATLGDILVGEEEDGAASEARLMLAPAMRRLSERDRRILYLRYFADLTQNEIGADLGVTQMQVSRLLTRIIGELRDDLGAAG